MTKIYPGFSLGGTKIPTEYKAGTDKEGNVIIRTEPTVYPGQVEAHKKKVSRTAQQVIRGARAEHGTEAQIALDIDESGKVRRSGLGIEADIEAGKARSRAVTSVVDAQKSAMRDVGPTTTTGQLDPTYSPILNPLVADVMAASPYYEERPPYAEPQIQRSMPRANVTEYRPTSSAWNIGGIPLVWPGAEKTYEDYMYSLRKYLGGKEQAASLRRSSGQTSYEMWGAALTAISPFTTKKKVEGLALRAGIGLGAAGITAVGGPIGALAVGSAGTAYTAYTIPKWQRQFSAAQSGGPVSYREFVAQEAANVGAGLGGYKLGRAGINVLTKPRVLRSNMRMDYTATKWRGTKGTKVEGQGRFKVMYRSYFDWLMRRRYVMSGSVKYEGRERPLVSRGGTKRFFEVGKVRLRPTRVTTLKKYWFPRVRTDSTRLSPRAAGIQYRLKGIQGYYEEVPQSVLKQISGGKPVFGVAYKWPQKSVLVGTKQMHRLYGGSREVTTAHELIHTKFPKAPEWAVKLFERYAASRGFDVPYGRTVQHWKIRSWKGTKRLPGTEVRSGTAAKTYVRDDKVIKLSRVKSGIEEYAGIGKGKITPTGTKLTTRVRQVTPVDGWPQPATKGWGAGTDMGTKKEFTAVLKDLAVDDWRTLFVAQRGTQTKFWRTSQAPSSKGVGGGGGNQCRFPPYHQKACSNKHSDKWYNQKP